LEVISRGELLEVALCRRRVEVFHRFPRSIT
jgi:hypothetical protein